MSFNKKVKGSITIYLSIMILSILLLICTISESARVNAIQTKTKDITYMSVDSVIAGYGKQIFKDYGILLVWENEPTKEKVKQYIQANINMADLKNKKSDLLNANLDDIKINKQDFVTDKGGETFVKQIISYMKYAIPIKAIKELKNKYNKYDEASKNNNRKKKGESSKEYNKVDKNLVETARKINSYVEELKNTKKLHEKIIAVNGKMEMLLKDIESESKNKENHKKMVKQFLKKYEKLNKVLQSIEIIINNAIKEGNYYEVQKEIYLKQNNIKTDDNDYMENNLKILQNGKNQINKINELLLLNISDVNQTNYNQIKNVLTEHSNLEDILKSLSVIINNEKDNENKSIFDSAKEFLNNGILSLVIDNISGLSNASIIPSSLPSKTHLETEKDVLKTVRNKIIMALYTNVKFGNYLEPKKGNTLQYELEYIISAKDKDKDNLSSVVKKLSGLRNIMNLMFLVKDREKMALISEVSLSAATVIGLPFLEPIFKGIIIEAWALAESINDVKILLKGNKIPLVKTSKNWRTSLKNIGGENTNEKNSKGLDYKNYLNILMLIGRDEDLIYRTMDLIEINIQNKYNKNFTMEKCFQSLDVSAHYIIPPMFTAFKFVTDNLSSNQETYKYTIKCSKSY